MTCNPTTNLRANIKIGDTIKLTKGSRQYRVTQVLTNDDKTIKGYLAHPLKAKFLNADNVKKVNR